MKDNYLKLKDSKGKKSEYRIIFDVEGTNKNVNYIIYTADNKDKNGDIICHASSYVLSDKGNMTKLKPISTDEEYEFITKILESLGSES